MSWMTLTGVGVENVAGGTSAPNPQLQYFENFPGHLGNAFVAISHVTLSVHAVNIPLSQSFNVPVVLVTNAAAAGDRSASVSFGLYSMNNGTLSLANSASGATSWSNAEANQAWLSLGTSAAQNITPGAWYWALNVSTTNGAGGGFSIFANTSFGAANVVPGGFLFGRMTASTGAMPASIATSDLDKTGADAIRQPYIIITA